MKRPTMTGADLKAFRARTGFMTQNDAARIMGFSSPNVISAMENGRQPISPQTERLIRAYEEGYRPKDWFGPGEGN